MYATSARNPSSSSVSAATSQAREVLPLMCVRALARIHFIRIHEGVYRKPTPQVCVIDVRRVLCGNERPAFCTGACAVLRAVRAVTVVVHAHTRAHAQQVL